MNCIFPKFKLKDFIKSKAYGKFSEKFLVKKKYDRARRGDLLHGSGAQQQYGDDPTVVACFGAIFQGDHLGVELATDAHVNLLGSAGLLLPHSRLRSDYPIAEDRLVDGLVIDDYFSISREPLSLAGREGDSLSVSAFKAAKSVYLREGLIGSDGKDVEGALNYKGLWCRGRFFDSKREERSCACRCPFGQEDESCCLISGCSISSLYFRCSTCLPSWFMDFDFDDEETGLCCPERELQGHSPRAS